jgi:transposase InsO family protein
MIEAIVFENPAYGYPRIKKALEEKYGEVVNHKLLMKLLKLWGLSLNRVIRKTKSSWISKILNFLGKRANLLWHLVREDKISRPAQVIVSDVTEIIFSNGKAYLSVHMDFFGKIIYGWVLQKNADSSLVVESFNRAIKAMKRFGFDILHGVIFHQDRGSIYTSAEYTSCVLSKKGTLSFSRTGEPGDNAVNESFFSRLKEEWRDVFFEAKDFEELVSLVKKAIEYYNNERLHSSIGYTTPKKFVQSYIGDLLQNQPALVC